MGRRNSDSGRQAVIWLGTSFVIVMGAGASAFVIIAGSDQPQRPLIFCGLLFSGLILMLLLMSVRWDQSASRLKVWLSAQNRNNPTDDYRAARRSIEAREEFGSNGPPTIESVKDAANHGGAWVPRSSGSVRQPKRS